MKTVGVMFSGGPDSATLLCDVLGRGYKPVALFFDYGQPQAEMELAAMRSICQKVGAESEIFDISRLKYNFVGLNGLNRVGFGPNFRCNCPHALFGIAASYLISRGIDEMYVGAIAGDFNHLEDFATYIEKISDAISALHGQRFNINIPFIGQDKAGVMRLAKSLSAPLELSWSCEGDHGRVHCGECKNCVARKKAFSDAGFADETRYSLTV